MKIKSIIRQILKEQVETYIYHGTSLENVKNILKNGFNENTYWGDESIAKNYAYSFGNPCLIKIPKNSIWHLLEPNWTLIEFYEDNIDDDVDYQYIIDQWNNSDKTVQNSLDIFDSAILPPTFLSLSNENIIPI